MKAFRAYHDQADAPAVAPRKWSSETPKEDIWQHKSKSDPLRKLIAVCKRKGFFVWENEPNVFKIVLRGKDRIVAIEAGSFQECMQFLDSQK